jgi:hypothetical protein
MKTAEATGSVVSDIFAAAWDKEAPTTMMPARHRVTLFCGLWHLRLQIKFQCQKK